MTSKKRQKIKVFALCFAICLSLASYFSLRVMENRLHHEDILLAEEHQPYEALPDVMLLKKLMHKTLEFMLLAPRF